MLSRDSIYIVDVFIWPKLVTVAFLWQNLSHHQFYKDLTKNPRFCGVVPKFNNLGPTLGTNSTFCNSVANWLKTKIQKVLGANSYVCRSYRGKTGRRGLFVPPSQPPSWKGLTLSRCFINTPQHLLSLFSKTLRNICL